MKTKILITGGAGFIGYNTANRLIDEDYDVRVFDNLSGQVHPDPKVSLSRLNPDVEFISGDVRNRFQIEAALEDIDIVYHFAAETGVGQSMYEIERYSSVNIQGTAVLCDVLAKKKNRVKKIILSSSRAVYGEGQYRCPDCGLVYPRSREINQLKNGNWELLCPKCCSEILPIPCKETIWRNPTSIYGLTKKVQEDFIYMTSKTYNIPIVILRYFNVFGEGQTASNPYTGVMSIFSSLILENSSLEIYEDGLMVRDFVPIEEVIEANLKTIELDEKDPLVINVGLGKPKTILELAETLKEETCSKSNIAITGRYRIGDIRHCFADISKQKKMLGSSQDDIFNKSIKKLISWILSEKKSTPLEHSVAELSLHKLSGLAINK